MKKKKRKQDVRVLKSVEDFESSDTMRFCRICGASLISTCDRTKKSELVEYMGQEWNKTKPQFMYMYPTAEKQSDLCFYHQRNHSADEF